MEYLMFSVVAVLFLVFIFVQGKMQENKERKWFLQKLRDEYGQKPQREYKPERYVRIPGYYECHREQWQIDDITWNDLGMDEIFERMNYTLSSTGEEYLYYRLRTPEFDQEKLRHFNEIVKFFDENQEERISFQLLMRKLGTTGKFSLYDYLEYLISFDGLSNIKEFFVLALFALSILVLVFNPTVGILALVALIAYQMFRYHKIRKSIDPYITSLAYMIRLNEIADKVRKLDISVCQQENQQILELIKSLQSMKRGSYWVFHDPKNNTSGNPLDAIMVYITMIFHVDLIIFHKMLSVVKSKVHELDTLAGILGYMETAVCVGLYRASLNNGYTIPEFAEGELEIEEAYHPLIDEPVKNSICASKSVLLTGSNASGKSTFLKTVALNTLLSQTVYTACAQYYKAPVYRLFSSMSLKDDLENGESYYIVEIKAIKRIMEAAAEYDETVQIPIICFVDEVLRGTNTTERIAASSQILKSFADKGVLCFAATHDLELTEILKEDFENYHFAEEVSGNDILFNYELQPGRATTKNAIRLLQLMGYDPSIIKKANEQAAHFEETGIWRNI